VGRRASMMFKIPIPTKKKQYTEELIKILEMYGTLKLQNEFLHNKIKIYARQHLFVFLE
jgi:hypothetical protein